MGTSVDLFGIDGNLCTAAALARRLGIATRVAAASDSPVATAWRAIASYSEPVQCTS